MMTAARARTVVVLGVWVVRVRRRGPLGRVGLRMLAMCVWVVITQAEERGQAVDSNIVRPKAREGVHEHGDEACGDGWMNGVGRRQVDQNG